MRNSHWSPEEIRDFSTEQIFDKLRSLGIEITPEQFISDAKNSDSACALAMMWEKITPLTAIGFELDFPWMAAMVLWERLIPERLSNEQLDDLMQKGYDFFEQDPVAASDLWLEFWSHLKTRLKPEIQKIDEADKVWEGMQFLSNWCQDLEMALGDAAWEDSSYHLKRLTYCQEFCELLPETNDLIIENLKRAQGEAYFLLGRLEEGEKVFQDLVKQFPHSAWAYIGWADMYWFYPEREQVTFDYAKAEEIYRLALKNQVTEPEEVRQRLKSLREERGTRGFGSSQSTKKKKSKKKK